MMKMMMSLICGLSVDLRTYVEIQLKLRRSCFRGMS